MATLRWLHSHWEIKTAADGTPTHAVGVMVDDSETVSMAAQLNQATAKLAIAVDLGEIIIFEQDLQADRIALNARGFEILGLPPRESGLSIDRVRCAGSSHTIATEMQAANVRGHGPSGARSTCRCDTDATMGNGGICCLAACCSGMPLDRPLAFVGVALDVTGRVEAQHAFEETARRLDVATTAAGVGIWSRDTSTGEGTGTLRCFG